MVNRGREEEDGNGDDDDDDGGVGVAVGAGGGSIVRCATVQSPKEVQTMIRLGAWLGASDGVFLIRVWISRGGLVVLVADGGMVSGRGLEYDWGDRPRCRHRGVA